MLTTAREVRLARLRRQRGAYKAALRILADAMQHPAWAHGTPWQDGVAYRQMICLNVGHARAAWKRAAYLP